MNKKGFTFTELMGVTVILALILMVAIPATFKLLSSSKENEFKSFEKTLFNAAEVFVETNKSFSIGVEETNFILVEELISAGYLKEDLINPKTSKKIELESSLIEVTKNISKENSYKYVFYAENQLHTISTVEDLLNLQISVKQGSDKRFERFHLISDIDFKDDNSYQDPNTTAFGDLNGNSVVEPLKLELTTGDGFNPIGSVDNPFKGEFHARGFSISNLFINTNNLYAGLFGYIENAKISGLNLLGVKITGLNYVGSLAGYAKGTNISNINATGFVTSSEVNASGIVGKLDSSQILNSSSTVTLFKN